MVYLQDNTELLIEIIKTDRTRLNNINGPRSKNELFLTFSILLYRSRYMTVCIVNHEI